MESNSGAMATHAAGTFDETGAARVPESAV